MDFDIIIIGGGVSGLIAAQQIASYSNYHIAIVEAGSNYKCRNNKLISGVGGAGTLAGAKFCLPPASSGIWKKTGYDIENWDKFISCLPLNNKLKLNMRTVPLGSMYCRDDFYNKKYNTVLLLQNEMNVFITHLINSIKHLGIEIIANVMANQIVKEKDMFLIETSIGKLKAKKVIYAGGRSGSLTFPSVIKDLNVNFKANSHDMGIRINMPRIETQQFGNIGEDIKIKTLQNNYLIRSFCVCSGGMATKVLLDDLEYWDGHFGRNITMDANIGILARRVYNDEISAIVFANELKYLINEEFSLNDFFNEHLWTKIVKNEKVLEILSAIRLAIKCGMKNGLFDFGISNSSIRLPAIDNYTWRVEVDSNLETACKGFYVIGDANGLSRGYIQSMWSGYVVANSILSDVFKTSYGGFKTCLMAK